MANRGAGPGVAEMGGPPRQPAMQRPERSGLVERLSCSLRATSVSVVSPGETIPSIMTRGIPQANATAGAADSVVSFQDAQARADRLRELASQDPSQANAAQGTLDSARVRGLLG